MADRVHRTEPVTAGVRRLVTARAPALFAVVEEHGAPLGVRITAWGLAFARHTEVVGVDGGVRMSLNGPQDALWLFGVGSPTTPRLVYLYGSHSGETGDRPSHPG